MNTRPTPETAALRDLYGNHVHRANVGDIWDLCESLERKQDEARAEMIRWQSIAEGRGRTDDDDTGKAMSNLIRQRDEAREHLAAARAEIDEIHATGGCSYIELHKVTAQRDRLAEACQDVVDSGGHFGDLVSAANNCQRTLQSLTPKP
jgi:hypothetical protein